MKAFVYSDWGVLEVQDIPVPVPAANEALIRVEACGICGSELETFKTRNPRRTPPLVLGHEFCGVIEEIGNNNMGLHPGDTVVVNSIISCGGCLPCLRGDTHLCGKRQVFGMNRPGAIAEFVAAPIDHIYPRPKTLEPVKAALAELTANAVHIMNLLPDVNRPTVVVIGAGAVGLMVLQAAIVLKNARVLVSDINDSRLEEARKLGAEIIVNSKRNDLLKSCLDFSCSDGVDLCIDAVGAAETKRQSLEVLRPGGSCCWIGLYDNKIDLNTYGVTLQEKKVLGTYAATQSDFKKAVELLAQNKVKGGDWVKVFKIDDAITAFNRMLKPEANDIKAVILPGIN